MIPALRNVGHLVKRSRFTQEQIAFALRQAESGTSVGEVCRKIGVSENTFYRWKRKYEGLGVAEKRVVEVLNRIAFERGLPKTIRVDHGIEVHLEGIRPVGLHEQGRDRLHEAREAN